MLGSYRYHIGFRDLWLRMIGIPVVGFLLPMMFFSCNPSNWAEFWPQWLIACSYTALYWHVDVWLVWQLRKRWPAQSDYTRRIVWTSAAVLTFTVLFCLITESNFGFSLSREVLDMRPTTSELLFASLTITVTVMAIYEAIYAVARWKESLVESSRLRKANMQAQLETLKNQVNPHFLFNSLNTLATIIPEDPDRAVTFVEKLSKVYRYILEIRKRELITLAEELECITAYGFLLEMRFGENLRVHIDIPAERMQDHIVPLSLQILMENAIKHNVVSASKPLRIHISLNKEGDVMVSNNLQKKQLVKDSTGSGLNNIDSRYNLLTGKRIEVITTQDHFRVIIPLVPVARYEATHH